MKKVPLTQPSTSRSRETDSLSTVLKDPWAALPAILGPTVHLSIAQSNRGSKGNTLRQCFEKQVVLGMELEALICKEYTSILWVISLYEAFLSFSGRISYLASHGHMTGMELNILHCPAQLLLHRLSSLKCHIILPLKLGLHGASYQVSCWTTAPSSYVHIFLHKAVVWGTSLKIFWGHFQQWSRLFLILCSRVTHEVLLGPYGKEIRTRIGCLQMKYLNHCAIMR